MGDCLKNRHVYILMVEVRLVLKFYNEWGCSRNYIPIFYTPNGA